MTARKLRIIRGAAAGIACLPGGLLGGAVGSAFDVLRTTGFLEITFAAILICSGVGSYAELQHLWFRLYPEQMKRIDSRKMGPGLFAPITVGFTAGYVLGLTVMGG
jgi:uncharacterized membrane protein YfcA